MGRFKLLQTARTVVHSQMRYESPTTLMVEKELEIFKTAALDQASTVNMEKVPEQHEALTRKNRIVLDDDELRKY